MKKMLCAMMALVLLCGVLSGCSLFTSDNKTETNAPASTAADTAGSTEAGSGNAPVKISDKFTFEDPADLTFETRYALYCDKNSSVVSTAASYGVKAMYSIMYADGEDIPVGYYEFIICDTPENAKAVIDLYTTFGTALSVAEEDPCVLYSFAAADSAEAMIISLQASGIISEATASAYIEYYKSYSGGTSVE